MKGEDGQIRDERTNGDDLELTNDVEWLRTVTRTRRDRAGRR
jgi:hypothetical protein